MTGASHDPWAAGRRTTNAILLMLLVLVVANRWLDAHLESRTVGRVESRDDVPLAGAIVELADNERVLARQVTDGTGQYRFALDRTTNHDYRLLVCAHDHEAFVQYPIVRRQVNGMRWTLRPQRVMSSPTEREFWYLTPQDWPFPIPAECRRGPPTTVPDSSNVNVTMGPKPMPRR